MQIDFQLPFLPVKDDAITKSSMALHTEQHYLVPGLL